MIFIFLVLFCSLPSNIFSACAESDTVVQISPQLDSEITPEEEEKICNLLTILFYKERKMHIESQVIPYIKSIIRKSNSEYERHYYTIYLLRRMVADGDFSVPDGDIRHMHDIIMYAHKEALDESHKTISHQQNALQSSISRRRALFYAAITGIASSSITAAVSLIIHFI